MSQRFKSACARSGAKQSGGNECELPALSACSLAGAAGMTQGGSSPELTFIGAGNPLQRRDVVVVLTH